MGPVCSNTKDQSKFNLQSLPYSIQVTAYIWCENGHNLFDYESESLIKKQIEFDFQGRVIQVDKDIAALTKTEYVRNQRDIFHLKCGPKSVEIHNPKEPKFWKVVRPVQASDLPTIDKQKLEMNAVIKLGRVQLTVLDYGFNYDYDGGQVADENEQNQELQAVDSEIFDGSLACRICFSKLSTIDNPFICPCKCSGSIKFIHLKCLQSWINVKMKKKSQNGVTLYYWKAMCCDICKQSYKTQFKFKNLTYDICDITKPKEPFLMLKIVHCEKNKDWGVYVIEIKNRDVIKIGRTQDCDIKMHDISVSRHHASIHIGHQDASLHLEDNCSKFGTLVEATNDDLTISHQFPRKVALQIGRTVAVVQLEKKNTKKQLKYRVPQQYEVFRQIKQEDDEIVEQFNEEVDQIDVEDILINDPNFDKDQDCINAKHINFLTGSIYQRDNNNQ